MAPADFLTEKRNEIAARLKELRPLVDEYQRLKAAAAALAGVAGEAPGVPAPASSPRRRRAPPARRRGATQDRPGQPRGSGTRGAQALAIVAANPGITIREIAAKMGIKQNYLYRVLPALVKDGLVVKEGRGWKATDAV